MHFSHICTTKPYNSVWLILTLLLVMAFSTEASSSVHLCMSGSCRVDTSHFFKLSSTVICTERCKCNCTATTALHDTSTTSNYCLCCMWYMTVWYFHLAMQNSATKLCRLAYMAQRRAAALPGPDSVQRLRDVGDAQPLIIDSFWEGVSTATLIAWQEWYSMSKHHKHVLLFKRPISK